MAANTAPIYTDTATPTAVAITAANVRTDGNGTIGTDIFKLFTAGVDGSLVSKIQFMPVNTTIGTATTATVARIFLATIGSGATTPGTNVWNILEWTLATATPSATAAMSPIVAPLNLFMPSGTYLLVTTHHAPAANTGWHATAFAGDY